MKVRNPQPQERNLSDSGTKGQTHTTQDSQPSGGQRIVTTTTTMTQVHPDRSGPVPYYAHAPNPYQGGGHRDGGSSNWPLIVMAFVAVVALVLWIAQGAGGFFLQNSPTTPVVFSEPAPAPAPAPAESHSGGIQDYAFNVPQETSWSEVPGAPGFRYQKRPDGRCDVNHPAEEPQPPPEGAAWLNRNCLP